VARPFTYSYLDKLARRLDGAGVYCLCLGDREGGRADKAMRARIAQMLAE
jgi:hypothetical protein